MSAKPPTPSKNLEDVQLQLRKKTPLKITELIARQLDRADEAAARIEEEGSVVRDPKGSVIPHPAIKIEIDATKIAAYLIAKHKTGP